MNEKWWGAFFSDAVFKRLARNLAYLFSANMVIALLGMLTLAVMARALGPAGLGIVALVEAYGRSVDRIVRFEPWQTLVRYGAAALEDGRDREFRRLVKFSTLFDVFGAGLAAAIAISFLTVASDWLGFDDDQTKMAMFFSATFIFSLSSTPTAVLRLFDRFDLIAKMSTVLATFRALLTIVAWQLGGDVWSFIIILMCYQIVEQLTPLAFAWRELRRRNYHDVWGLPFDGLLRENPGLLSFLWNVNIHVIARNSIQRFDTLILGVILGPAAVGLFQLAKRSGLAALRLGRPLQQAIYPDVARLWARGEILRFRHIVLRVSAVMGAAGIVAFAILSMNMELLVRLVFGEAFVAASPVIVVQLLAATVFLAGNALVPAMMSMGEAKTLFRITFASVIVFFIAFVPLVQQFDTMGASLSHLLFNAISLVAFAFIFLDRTKVPDRQKVAD